MLMKKIQRHDAYVVMNPPSGGPITGAISPGQTMRPIASMIWCFGVSRSTTRRPTGDMNAAAAPCSSAGGDERPERRGEAAQKRCQREHGDGRGEEVARAEPVACPAGGRDEYRHGDEVDRDAGGKIERGFAEALRDGGQRGRDDRAVQRLHEERRRDDERVYGATSCRARRPERAGLPWIASVGSLARLVSLHVRGGSHRIRH